MHRQRLGWAADGLEPLDSTAEDTRDEDDREG